MQLHEYFPFLILTSVTMHLLPHFSICFYLQGLFFFAMTHSVLFRRSDCHMGCFKSAWRAVLSSTLLHAGLLHQATISRFYVVLQCVNADCTPAVPHLHHRMAAGTHTRPQPAPPLWTQSEHQLTVWSQVASRRSSIKTGATATTASESGVQRE